MKKIIASILLGSAIMLTTSCDDYLEVDYYDILPATMQFETENGFDMSLMACYDMFYPSSSAWSMQPLSRLGTHPTLDTGALGWDRNYGTQDWSSITNGEFNTIYSGAYRAIFRVHLLLDALNKVDDSFFAQGKAKKDLLTAEARAIRAFNYLLLYKAFGGVPKFVEGDDYINVPARERATRQEILDYVISDLEFAHPLLNWLPDKYGANPQYGRITKGAVLGYLAEAYMWYGALTDAVLGGNYLSTRTQYYQKAKDINLRIINEGPYSLMPCFSFLFDSGPGWTTEDVWTVVLWSDFGPTMGASGNAQQDHYWTYHANAASMEYGGYGSLFISWEMYHRFEPGDRRKEATCVALGETNIWTKQTLGANNPNSFGKVRHGGEWNPNVSSAKWWRYPVNSTINRYAAYAFRFLRLTNIMLNYAECCWALGEYDDPTAWQYINDIRNRAFGNLEVDWEHPKWNHPHANFSGIEACPSPHLDAPVSVPDAKEYYTNYKTYFDGLSYDGVNVLLVAINLERSKEFNAEFTNFYDFKRTGFIAKFLDVEYPYTPNPPVPKNSQEYYDVKQTYRHFQNSEARLAYYPIPHQELINNRALTNGLIDPIYGNNPGY